MAKISDLLRIPFIIGEEAPIEKEFITQPSLAGFRISENFDLRSYRYYDISNPSEKELMYRQSHVDLRTFTKYSGEEWKIGETPVSYTENSATRGYPAIEVKFTGTGSAKVIESVPGRIIDLETGFSPESLLICTFPEPTAKITYAESFLELTSSSDGSFKETESVKIPIPKPIGATTNISMIVERSTIEKNKLNLKHISGVRFTIQGKSGTVYIAGLRLVSKLWKAQGIDFDNWNNLWRKTISIEGNFSSPETTQPVLWRSYSPAGTELDPRPIDIEMAITFNTGTITGNEEQVNSVSFYARGNATAYLNQGDLESPPYETQEGIEKAFSGQPEFGDSKYGPRALESLEGETISALERFNIKELEEVENNLEENWINYTLYWGFGTNNNKINISGAGETPGYTLNMPELTSNNSYTLVISLVNNTSSLTLYKLEENGKKELVYANPAVFQSGDIYDPNLFARRKGRIGWTASLYNPKSYIASFQTKYLSFAEFRSVPFRSQTPVSGANLFVSTTEKINKYTSLIPSSKLLEKQGNVKADISRTTTGRSNLIEIVGTSAEEAALTNIFSFNSITNGQINFDLWYPQGLPALYVALNLVEKEYLPVGTSYNRRVFFSLPQIDRGQWQKIKISLNGYPTPFGNFVLEFYPAQKAASSAPYQFWVDKIEIYEKPFEWSARPIADNPWKTNYAPWTPFNEFTNGKGTAQFNKFGKELQFKGVATEQEATISSSPKIEPVYTQLGRIIVP